MQFQNQSAFQSSSQHLGSQQNSSLKQSLSSMKKTDNSRLAQAFASGFKDKNDGQEVQETLDKLNKKCYTLREAVESSNQKQQDLAQQIKVLKNQNMDLDSRLQGLTIEFKKLLQLNLDTKFPELSQKCEEIVNHIQEQSESITLCNEACHDYILFKEEFGKAVNNKSKR